MSMRVSNRWLAVFFLAVGYICAGPVTAADSEDWTEEATDLFVGPEDELSQGQTVEVGTYGQIELHVKDLDLTQILQLLSIQSQRNIIASRNVVGTVSADLYGVDFYEALDAILHTNGFGYEERGKFIYVYTTEELDEIKQAQAQTITKVVWLNYIRAQDASAMVSLLLSDSGQIAVPPNVTAGMEPSLTDAGANTSAHSERLILVDYPERVAQILDLLQELDVRPPQVLVEATILQARLTEENAFGVDWAIFADLNIVDFTNPLKAVDDLIMGTDPLGNKYNSGTAITSNAGNVTSGKSSLQFGVVSGDAAVFIRALDSVTDITVLAAPKIMVLNRQRARLHVGEKLGYLSLQQTETASTQTVEFLEVGTELTLRPFVSNDGFIRLELRPSVSDGDTTRIVNGFVIPEETSQELITNVFVRSGSTLVLGGLFKEDTTIGRRQVPGVGNIPGIGYAFRGQDDTVTRSEVIFLIKPTVVRDENLIAFGERMNDDIEMQRLGARKGLLPWSRTKLTAHNMRQALKLRDAGDPKKALWYANLALYLHPNLPDALKLKEQMTGEQIRTHDFSILNKAIDQEIHFQIGEADTMETIDEALDAMEAIDTLDTIEEMEAMEALEDMGGIESFEDFDTGEAWEDTESVDAWEHTPSVKPWKDEDTESIENLEAIEDIQTAIEPRIYIDSSWSADRQITTGLDTNPVPEPQLDWDWESHVELEPQDDWGWEAAQEGSTPQPGWTWDAKADTGADRQIPSGTLNVLGIVDGLLGNPEQDNSEALSSVDADAEE